MYASHGRCLRKIADKLVAQILRAKHHKLVWFVASVSIRQLIRMKHYPKGFTGVQGIHLYTIPALEQTRSTQNQRCASKVCGTGRHLKDRNKVKHLLRFQNCIKKLRKIYLFQTETPEMSCQCGLSTTLHIMRFNLPCTGKSFPTMWASLTPMKAEGMYLKPNSFLAVTVVLHDRMAQPKKADSVRLTVAGNCLLLTKTRLLGTSLTHFFLQLNLHKGKGASHPPTYSIRALKSTCCPT